MNIDNTDSGYPGYPTHDLVHDLCLSPINHYIAIFGPSSMAIHGSYRVDPHVTSRAFGGSSQQPSRAGTAWLILGLLIATG